MQLTEYFQFDCLSQYFVAVMHHSICPFTTENALVVKATCDEFELALGFESSVRLKEKKLRLIAGTRLTSLYIVITVTNIRIKHRHESYIYLNLV